MDRKTEDKFIELYRMATVMLRKSDFSGSSHDGQRLLTELATEHDNLGEVLTATPRGMAHLMAIDWTNGGRFNFVDIGELEFLVPFAEVERILAYDNIDDLLDDHIAAALVAAAWKNPDAWDAVKRLCGDLLSRKRALPASLMDFVSYDLSFGRPADLKPKGRRKGAHTQRNLWIKLAGEFLSNYQIPKVGGYGSHTMSVCGLISEVLGAYGGGVLTEDAVRKVLDSKEDPAADLASFLKMAQERIGRRFLSGD